MRCVHAVAAGGEARSAPFRVYWVVHLSVGHSVGFLMRPSGPWMSHAAQAITLFARANDRRLAMQARINLALAHAVHEHGVEAMPHLNRMVEYARADDRLEASNAAVTEAKALVPLGLVAEAEERYRMAIAYFQAVGASRRLMAASLCLCAGPARVGTR